MPGAEPTQSDERSRVASVLSLPGAGGDPYAAYRRLSELDPVHFNPFVRMWFLTRHADCTFVLRDGRFSARLGQQLRRRDQSLPASMLTSDPPEHGRLRRPAAEAFGERSAEALRPGIEHLVETLLDELPARGEIDLVEQFARVLSVRLLAQLLGIPPEHFDRFRTETYATAPNLDPLAPPDEQRRGARAADAVGDLLRDALARTNGTNELVAGLAPALDRGDLSQEEAVSMCTLLVVGGHEPLAGLIANGVLALLRHPEELDRWGGGASLDATAVDELLRFDSPIQFAARVAQEDVEVGGREIRGGQPVVTLLGAANRDPSIFPDPDRLDLGRRPNPHLAFGTGPHLCLGAPLTRVAARVAFDALFRRFPGLALADDEVEWRTSLVPHAPASLSVRLG